MRGLVEFVVGLYILLEQAFRGSESERDEDNF